jgi:casein kinase II subunit beta
MDLYGLIHSRFIISTRGLHMMRAKYLNGVFGACPRVLCDRQLVLPVGMSEDLSISRVKVYCPKCEEVYVPRIKFVDIDGAYFGCSFPHIFFQVISILYNFNLNFVNRLFRNFYQLLVKEISM